MHRRKAIGGLGVWLVIVSLWAALVPAVADASFDYYTDLGSNFHPSYWQEPGKGNIGVECCSGGPNPMVQDRTGSNTYGWVCGYDHQDQAVCNFDSETPQGAALSNDEKAIKITTGDSPRGGTYAYDTISNTIPGPVSAWAETGWFKVTSASSDVLGDIGSPFLQSFDKLGHITVNLANSKCAGPNSDQSVNWNNQQCTGSPAEESQVHTVTGGAQLLDQWHMYGIVFNMADNSAQFWFDGRLVHTLHPGYYIGPKPMTLLVSRKMDGTAGPGFIGSMWQGAHWRDTNALNLLQPVGGPGGVTEMETLYRFLGTGANHPVPPGSSCTFDAQGHATCSGPSGVTPAQAAPLSGSTSKFQIGYLTLDNCGTVSVWDPSNWVPWLGCTIGNWIKVAANAVIFIANVFLDIFWPDGSGLTQGFADVQAQVGGKAPWNYPGQVVDTINSVAGSGGVHPTFVVPVFRNQTFTFDPVGVLSPLGQPVLGGWSISAIAGGFLVLGVLFDSWKRVEGFFGAAVNGGGDPE